MSGILQVFICPVPIIRTGRVCENSPQLHIQFLVRCPGLSVIGLVILPSLYSAVPTIGFTSYLCKS